VEGATSSTYSGEITAQTFGGHVDADDGASRMDRLKQMIANGGPLKEDYEELNRIIDSIDCEGVDSAEHELLNIITPVLVRNTMQGHAFHKPHGYAGDYEIIDKIYTYWHSPDPGLRKWDEFFHCQDAVVAVRNRKQYLIDLLHQIERSRNLEGERSLKVLNVGSGPARDVREYFESNPDSIASFDCIEVDRNAIQYANRVCAPYVDRIDFINKNIFRFRSKERYDLIWSAGLFDYLNDKQFETLLARLMSHLKEDGILVIGNFARGNPSRSYMEKFGEWFLNHRTEEELRTLAERAGVRRRSIQVSSEERKVNLFLHVDKSDRSAWSS